MPHFFSLTFLMAVMAFFWGDTALAMNGPWRVLPGSTLKPAAVNSAFRWSPDGDDLTPTSRECHWTRFEALVARRQNEASRARDLKRWFARCEIELRQNRIPTLTALLRQLNIDYSIAKDNRLRKVEFTLKDGRTLRALVAFKDDRRPRPLVIAKCGIYCDAIDGGSSRIFFMHLFEESPFHLVVLENSSGAEFSQANDAVAWGGFDEGIQTLDVLQQISRSSLRERISGFHLAGFSLGAHGVLYASLYNSFPENGFPSVRSTLAICPVIDLEASVNRGMTGALRGAVYEGQAREVVRSVWESVSFINDLIGFEDRPGRKQLMETLKIAATDYYRLQTTPKSWPWAPFRGTVVDNFKDLARVNRFQDYAAEVRVPTLVVYAKDDGFVESGYNSIVLEKSIAKKSLPSLGVVGLSSGNHCAIGGAYGWRTMTSLMRGHVMAHAPEAVDMLKVRKISFESFVHWRFEPRYRYGAKLVASGWRLSKGSGEVRLRVRVWSPVGKDCDNSRPSAVRPSCMPVYTASVPLRFFKGAGLSIPRSDGEANAMSRWLNTNSWLIDQTGDEMTGKIDVAPTGVAIRGVFGS